MGSRKLGAMLADELPDTITIAEASEQFGLSRATLFRLIRVGKLKAYRREAGRYKTYVDKAEVKRLVRLKVRVVKR
jgi:excisionase family DNA binding protein